MLKKKSELAEEIHNDVQQKMIANDIEVENLEARVEGYKHGTKEKIEGIAAIARAKSNQKFNENLLLKLKRKITKFKAEEAKGEK